MPERWMRVGEAVQQRRGRIGIAANRLAVLADVSPATLSKLENGTGGRSAKVLGDVSEALGWPRDALADIASGADPAALMVMPPPGHELGVRVVELETETRELRDELRSQRQALDILLERTEHLRGGA